ncbi:hypothetical protein MHBO_002884 [Bonamia ostreae]|uniref:Transmembrane protein n=1 Tax=Bonamia ostreae TaxID=126728 RepID=A0ABV2ANV0_9EUKA
MLADSMRFTDFEVLNQKFTDFAYSLYENRIKAISNLSEYKPGFFVATNLIDFWSFCLILPYFDDHFTFALFLSFVLFNGSIFQFLAIKLKIAKNVSLFKFIHLNYGRRIYLSFCITSWLAVTMKIAANFVLFSLSFENYFNLHPLFPQIFICVCIAVLLKFDFFKYEKVVLLQILIFVLILLVMIAMPFVDLEVQPGKNNNPDFDFFGKAFNIILLISSSFVPSNIYVHSHLVHPSKDKDNAKKEIANNFVKYLLSLSVCAVFNVILSTSFLIFHFQVYSGSFIAHQNAILSFKNTNSENLIFSLLVLLISFYKIINFVFSATLIAQELVDLDFPGWDFNHFATCYSFLLPAFFVFAGYILMQTEHLLHICQFVVSSTYVFLIVTLSRFTNSRKVMKRFANNNFVLFL